ncbi:MAG: phenylacetate--CoA ligase family protein, partial [Candidatus Binatia bacterium]
DRLDLLTPAALRRWWTRRVRRILEIAAAELPFYRRRFAEVGFDAAAFRRLEDLEQLPTFRKRDVLEAQNRLGSHALGIERVAKGTRASALTLSSGTIGTTFITISRRWRRLQARSSARGHWWAGFRGGSPFVISAPAWHNSAAIQPALAEFFDSPCVVVAGTYLPRYADRIVDAFRRFRPRYITMFLPMVFPILSAARRYGLEPRRLFDGVETLIVTGAPITPGMRAHLQDLTGVGRVSEVAGTSESVLAMECREQQGLHVVPDTCYVEVLDPESGKPVEPGARGSLVHCFLIPEGSVYLRYDSEDAATIDETPCPCGLPSPRIKIVGRWEHGFRLAGRPLLPYDVQLAIERGVPETIGMPFVIVREALAKGALRLLLPEPETNATPLRDAVTAILEREFSVGAEIAWVRELPLQFKGVAPVLSETQVG